MAELMSYLIGIEKLLSSQLKGRDDVSQRRLSDVLLKAKMYCFSPVGSVACHRRKTRRILPTSSLMDAQHVVILKGWKTELLTDRFDK